MRAVLVDEITKKLSIGEFPDPIMKGNDVLISVKAAALNRADIIQKKGFYPPPEGESPILGLEISGVIEDIGESVEGWEKGDRVFALLPGGGYAEKVVVPSKLLMKIPDNLSFEEAAGVPEAFLTAYLNLFVIGQAKKGEDVLIHAAASGVGTAAIQLASLNGNRIFATAGSDEKLEFCSTLGANELINYKKDSFLNKVLEVTKGKGVEVILDFVGASYWDDNMTSIAISGRWIIIGVLGGFQKTIDIRKIIEKRPAIFGTTLRTKSLEEKIDLVSQFTNDFLPLFENGKLKPIIDKVYNWNDVERAHNDMELNKNIGKLILKIE